MPPPIIWTPEQDATIRRMRGQSATWNAIAAELGISRWTLIVHGLSIGARLPDPEPVMIDDPDRDPLPAGHSETWGVIVRGTCLDGTPYPRPGSDPLG